MPSKVHRLLELPHPHLIALRSAATLLISCVIGQAGWASAFLGGQDQFYRYHAVGAWVTLAVALATAVLYLLLRRSAGPVNVGLAVLLAVVTVAQVALGESDQRALHIFVGVLTAMLATALTSWTYRHRMTPEPPAPRPVGPATRRRNA